MPGCLKNLWSSSGQMSDRILSRIALDLLRLVDAIDQDDDARKAQRLEYRLQLAQEPKSLFGTVLGSRRQGLASQFRGLEPEQFPAQGCGIATEHALPLADVAGEPFRPDQPPAPVQPSGHDRKNQPGQDSEAEQRGKRAMSAMTTRRRPETDLQVAPRPERAKARLTAEPAPPPDDRPLCRCVVERCQQQQVAALVHTQDREVDFLRDQLVDQLCHAQRQDRVHVVLEPPLFQDVVHLVRADRRLVAIEIGIEVVVRDHEDALGRVRLIVRLELRFRLQPQCGLAASLLTEYQGGRRIGRAAEKLAPRRMMHCRKAAPLEYRISLSVLLAEGIADDSVMLKKMIELHPEPLPLRKVKRFLLEPFLLPNSSREGNPSRLTVRSTGPYDAICPRGNKLERGEADLINMLIKLYKCYLFILILALISLAPIFCGGCGGGKESGSGQRTGNELHIRVAAASDLQTVLPEAHRAI